MQGVNGLHHITAIAGPAQENLDFYAGVLGMRLVKKSVNQDDPGTYHLYFGNEAGSPGSILTFFPWPQAPRGVTRGRMLPAMAIDVHRPCSSTLLASASNMIKLEAELALAPDPVRRRCAAPATGFRPGIRAGHAWRRVPNLI